MSDEESGISVSINSDGTVVVIGAYSNDDAYTNTGTTRIYEWNDNDWVLKGNQINGLTEGEYSGLNVSINSDGSIVAIGANYNNDAYTRAGTTRIYEWNDNDWVLKGNQINGLTEGEFSGQSVSINSDGTSVAIGAHRYNSSTGCVRVYGSTSTSTPSGNLYVLAIFL